MDRVFRKLLRTFAPRTEDILSFTAEAMGDQTNVLAALQSCQKRIEELEHDVDELRKDNLRIAELYDLVFERLKSENPL